jgi:alpha-glucosidase
VTRYGQVQNLVPPSPSNMISAARRQGEVDIAVGSRRARAAAMIELALPGTPFLYQGEEIGLPEVLDLPHSVRTDPIWVRSGGTELGRDGCRVPLPWTDDGDSFGFSDGPVSAASWLPQPEWFADFSVDRALDDPESMLHHYRALIGARRTVFELAAPLRWIDLDDPHVLAFARGDGICLVNFGPESTTVPAEWDAVLVMESLPVHTGEGDIVVPADGAVWLASANTDSGVVGSPPTTAAQ